MQTFFVKELLPLTVVYGADAKHIAKALRMRAGESLRLCDGAGQVADGVIESLSPDAVSVRLGAVTMADTEPALKISLYCGWPKGDKAEVIVQKAVELGAYEVVFFLSARCISRPDERAAEKKLQRLNKIAAEAAVQSGRGMVPAVRGILPWRQAVEELLHLPAYLLYEGDCPPLRQQLLQKPERLALVTGCEGGFEPAEVALCEGFGITPVSLGKRILRCETAPLAVLSAVLYYFEEFC